MDLFRFGRPCVEIGLRLPHHLCRSDADDRAVHAAGAADRAPRQEPEHHLDRRLHRRALRQTAVGRGAGRADRDCRDDSLYRAAAESGVGDVRHRLPACRAAFHADNARRYRAADRIGDGGFRDPVRHPAHRRDRASGRADARDRDRVHRQARGLPRGRAVRDLLDVWRSRRPVLARAEPARYSGRADHRAEFLDRDRDDAALDGCDPPVAAAVPCHSGGEPFGSRDQARALAVPALSRADQSVRGADRACGPLDLPARQGRQRHVRAGPAAVGRCIVLHDRGLHRWPLGGHCDGDCGIGRARHHGVERSRGAVLPQAAVGAGDRRGRRRRIAAADSQDCDLPHPGAGLSVLPLGRRRAACRHRPSVLCRGRAACAGVFRRPVLAPGHRPRRHRRTDRRNHRVVLYAAVAERGRQRACQSFGAERRPVRNLVPAADRVVRPRRAAACAWRVLESCAQHHRLYRLLAEPRTRSDRARAGRSVRARFCARAEFPAVALGGDRERTHHGGGALYRAGAHALVLRELRRRQTHRPVARQFRRFPAAAACRTSLGFGDRRGIVASRAVAAAAQAHGVHPRGAPAARRCQCGDPLQPRNPADRAGARQRRHRGVRQGTATDLLEPHLRRNPRPAARHDRHWYADGRDPAASCRTRRLRPRRYRGAGGRTHEALLHRLGAFHRAFRGARPRARSARQPDAGRRHRHDLHRCDAELRGGRGAGAAGPRAHHAIDAAERGTGARQGRCRGGQYLQDAIPRSRQSRHPAAAQCRAALCDVAGGASWPGARAWRGRPAGRQHRCVARCRGGNSWRAARHFAARHRGDEAGNQFIPARRGDASA